MIVFYGICLLASVLLYVFMWATDVKKSVVQNLMILIMIISDIGFFCYGLSTNLAEAVLTYKITYVGGCFIPILYFFTVCEICNRRVKKSVRFGLTIMQVGLFLLVCTIGYNGWYYKEVSFVVENGVPNLVRVYGPGHMLYLVSMLAYFFASLILAIYAYIKNTSVNNKEIRNMIVGGGLAIFCYAVQRIYGFKYDLTVVSYIILMIGATVPIYHSNLYMVEENRDIIKEELGKLAFITFNWKMEYMGANQYALNLFEELTKVNVGFKVENPSEELSIIIKNIESLKKLISNDKSKEYIRKKKLVVNDSHYEAEIHPLFNFLNRCVGFTVDLRDETEHLRVIELTEMYNEELEREVEAKTERIQTIQNKTILGIATLVESRDLSTGGHIKRTSDVVRIFSKKLLEADMGFTKRFLDLVIRSAPMHDLGKIGVDDAILRKQGGFTDEEYAMMKSHAKNGGEMVREILTGVEEEDFVKVAYNVATYHHEKVNGRGYPEGLRGDEIPVEARIMALADVFDTLASKRCYKEPLSYEESFAIIDKDAGEHFDKALADVFLQCRDELIEYYDSNR